MARGKGKKPRQAEKLLLILLDGHVASMDEVQGVLGGTIEMYRLSAYLWDLRQMGAEIKTITENRKISALQLTNHAVMYEHAKSRGLVHVPTAPLTTNDFMVSST